MRRFFLAFVLLFAFFSATAFAAESGSHHFVRVLDFDLAKTDTNWTIDDARTNRAAFSHATTGGDVRFWNPQKSIWLRIPVASLARQTANLSHSVLALQTEFLSQADFYLPRTDGTFEKLSHGLRVPIGQRSFPSRFPSLRLRNVDENALLYVHLRSNLPTGLRIVLSNEDAFYSITLRNLTAYMAFYSFIGAMTLTYLFFYLMTGHKGYALSLLRQLGICLFVFCMNGFLQLSFNLNPRLVYAVAWMGFSLYAVAASLFWRHMSSAFHSNRWLRLLPMGQTAVAAVALSSAILGELLIAITGTVVIVGFELLTTLLVVYQKYGENSKRIALYAASRFSFIAGLAFFFVDMLFPSRALFQNLFIAGLVLDPLFLACMLIPYTRSRIESYLSLEKENAHYEMLSRKDSMTGLYNKANLLHLLANNLEIALASHGRLSFVMIDIDYFKRYNDTWGHPEGDKALLFLAQAVQNCLRGNDIAARYGGEEFSIILPGVTLPVAMTIAERIRSTCESGSHSLGENKNFTISMGISSCNANDTVESLIKRADKALYFAKASGRNRIETERSILEPKGNEQSKSNG